MHEGKIEVKTAMGPMTITGLAFILTMLATPAIPGAVDAAVTARNQRAQD